MAFPWLQTPPADPAFYGFPAPAKLNLMLKIVGRRADGYHLLETVFRFIDYGDTIWLAPDNSGQIVLETPLPNVAPEHDLTVRAARTLQQATACQAGVRIRVDKRLPMGGGLGGGSSDAATTLMALNQLWELGLSREALQNIAVKLGADVPVFIFGEAAFASGIGEELTTCAVPSAWYVVLHPGVEVATAKIFASEGLTRNSPKSIMRALETTQRQNTLQNVVFEMFPEVKNCYDSISHYGDAMMTGSGACVFLECESQKEAEQVYCSLADEYQGFIAEGLKEHPFYSLSR